jgi:uncharacterized protein (UPF0548 family)
MGFHLRRSTDRHLNALLERSRDDELTYEPVGVSLEGHPPSGFARRRWSRELVGPDSFDRASAALRRWAVHRGAGLLVATDGPLVVGTNVAVSARVGPGFVDACCRIVRVLDEPDRYGFAYGTLSNHPECGEEAFVVSRVRDADADAARFDIEAVSRPNLRVARTVPAIHDRIQDRAARRYLAAMQRA